MSESRRRSSKRSAEDAPRSKRKRSRATEEDEAPRKKRKRAADETGRSKRKRANAEDEAPAKPAKSRRKKRDRDGNGGGGDGDGRKSTSKRKRKRAEAEDEAPATGKSRRKKRDRDADDDGDRKKSSRRKRADDDDGGRKSRRGESKRETKRESKREKRGDSKRETGRSRRSRRGDDDDFGDEEASGGGMGKILLIILIVTGIGGAAFFLLKPKSLPELIADLDKVKAPTDPYKNKHYKRSPIKELIALGKAAIPECEKVVADDSRKDGARIGACIVLGKLESVGSIDVLCAALSASEKVSWNAGGALVRIAHASDDAVTKTGAVIMSAKETTALYALELLLRFKKRSLTIPSFEQAATKHKNPKIRIEALKLLSQVVQPEAAIIMARCLDDADPEVREAANAGLAGKPPAELLKAGTKMIASTEAAERRLAMLLVRNVGERAQETLETGLADKDLGVSTSATVGLAKLINAEHAKRESYVNRVKELCGLAKDDDHLRELGLAAGRSAMVELEDLFMDWLEKGEKGQRIAAVEALEGMADSAWVHSQLLPYIDDEDAEVAKTVAMAMRRAFIRGSRKWGRVHMPFKKPYKNPANRKVPPKAPAEWQAWWKNQKWMLDEDLKAEKEVKEALKLMQIKPRKWKTLDKAQKILERARERLFKMHEKTEWDQPGIIKITSYIQMCNKLRPTNKED